MVKDYKDTLLMPKTEFPMRAGLPKREPGMLEQHLNHLRITLDLVVGTTAIIREGNGEG